MSGKLRPPSTLIRPLVSAIVLTLLCGFRTLLAADRPLPNSPLSPQESLSEFEIQGGLTIEVVACEPQIVDPVAARFDENGRLWVVEMRDYPNGPAEGEQPKSQIVVLDDRDGDGRYETSHVFAEHLLFPTGLQPWKGGLIVTLAGKVSYLKDTNGDDRADVDETWFTGFTAENPQLRANHPRLALDGHVYVANGLRGGVISDPRRPNQKPISISGMDFRFDPRTGDCEAVSGNGQFGLTFDDFGRRYVCSNRNPLIRVMLENRYLARNPFYAVPAVVEDIAPAGEASRVYPISKTWTTSNLHAGQFTAACGVEIWHGDAFTCEPTGNLVHFERLASREFFPDKQVGAGALAPGAPRVGDPKPGVEFLASRDSWFRPVNLEVGPDGSLYVVDMYRAVIEHPQFMPNELKNRPDLRLGDDCGRIYRIRPAQADARTKRPALGSMSDAELVNHIRGAGTWWRNTASRLLIERHANKPVGDALRDQLEAIVLKSDPQAVGEAISENERISALWCLKNLKVLRLEVVRSVLADAGPELCDQAFVIWEKLPPDERKALQDSVIESAARVESLQGMLTIGQIHSPEAIQAVVGIAFRNPTNNWLRRALVCSPPQNAVPIMELLLPWASVRLSNDKIPALVKRKVVIDPQTEAAAAGLSELIHDLAMVVGALHDTEDMIRCMQTLLANVRHTPLTDKLVDAGLLGFAEGVRRKQTTLPEVVALWVKEAPPEHQQMQVKLDSQFMRLDREARASKKGTSTDRRIAAIRLLRHAGSPEVGKTLLGLAAEDADQSVRIAAIDALADYRQPEIAPKLLEHFSAETPPIRRAILDVLIGPPDSAGVLLSEIEAGRVPRAEIDLLRTQRLLQHSDAGIQARAKKLLDAAPPADRQKVLDEYQAVLKLAGQATAGQEVFRKHCTACHKIGKLGVNVAPDISDSREKLPAQILTDILNPNLAIDNNYLSYVVATHEGKLYTGIIATETAASITLRQPENKTVDLLRSDIESIRSTGVSLMPEGLEKDIPPQQMADLISFIKNWRYLAESEPKR